MAKKALKRHVPANGFIVKCKPYIFSTLPGCIVFFGGLFLLSFFMLKYYLDEPVLYYVSYVLLLLGGFLCGKHAFKRMGGRGFLTGIKGCIPFTLIAFAVLCIIASKISVNIIIVIPICILGGFLGGIAAVNKK